MSEHKLRRKSFLLTVGAIAMGWMGVKASGTRTHGLPAQESSEESSKGRVRVEPRAVPCSGRTL